MKPLFCILLALFLTTTSYGQQPDWEVAEHDYEHTMSLVAFVNVDGRTLTSDQDRVAAFVDGVCRGVSKLTEVKSHQEHFAYLTVFGNTNNELVNFKIYEAENDRILDVDQTLVFRINAHSGNLLQPYSIAQPALRATANIASLGLANIVPLGKTKEEGKITFKVENGTNLGENTLEFELEDGAQLFWNNQPLISGDNSIDFSEPVTLHVRSEDRSVMQPWTVSVELLGDILVFRRNATCFGGGAIKVTGNREGQNFTLMRQGQVISTRSMVNGEVLFENLVQGNYLVSAEAFEKQVTVE
ncbi:hypothetical protein [Pleomorphovibrio marinus]|uniref:hypothetical protein n=1 Tax=Pleomorphovibrio marinus TaxID=2164132 RepID=UPI001300AD3E|nr:hypothetical protein [Pleomorphovibrio marinus]